MGFRENNNDGVKFSKENQPPNRGRKPALYKQLKAIVGKEIKVELSREDFHRITQWLLERTKEELQQLAKDDKTPVFMLSLISAIISDIKGGSMNTVDRLADRLYGKPKQINEVTGKDGATLISSITVEVIDSRDKIDNENTNNNDIH